MNCPSCGVEQPEDAKFCKACGVNLFTDIGAMEREEVLPDLEGQKVIARVLSRDDIAPFIERWGNTHRFVAMIPMARAITEDERKTTESLAVGLVVMEKRD